MVKAITPARWPDAAALEEAVKAFDAEETRLRRVRKQHADASGLSAKLRANIGSSYTEAVLLGDDPPTQDPNDIERLREADALKEATSKAEPTVVAAVNTAKRRVAEAGALLTGRKLRWAEKQQEAATTALADHLAAALPHLAHLMAATKVREEFSGQPYKVSEPLAPAWSGFRAGQQIVAAIPKQLRSKKLSDDAVTEAVAELFLTLQAELKGLSQ